MISILRRLGAPRKSKSTQQAIRCACEPVEQRLLLASITGNVFHDASVNGVRNNNEAGLAGATVYIDVNGNGHLDGRDVSTTTDGSGNYAFNNLANGTYAVRQQRLLPYATHPTNPFSGVRVVTVTDAAPNATGVNFGNARFASVSGRVFNDINGNATQGNGEGGIPGVKVFADYNNNKVADAGEPSAVTNGLGNYRLNFLRPGYAFNIRFVEPTNLKQTSPALNAPQRVYLYSGQNATGRNFGAALPGTIAGVVFRDDNGDRLRQPNEPLLASRMVYLDLNNNGVYDVSDVATYTNDEGKYGFSNVAPGRYRVAIDSTNEFAVTTPVGGSQLSNVTSNLTTRVDFGLGERARISGVFFADNDGDGLQDFDERGLGNRIIYLDFNNNGTLDAADAQTLTNADGQYIFRNLNPGNYRVRAVYAANEAITTPLNGRLVSLQLAEDETGVNFGASAGAIITGYLFSDANGNGLFGADENPLVGRRVYLDDNNNGVFDAGERSAITQPDGQYTFQNVKPGQVTVRTTIPSGALSTVPTAGFYRINLVAAQVRMLNFGFSGGASFSGTIFSDTNGNGVQDGGEAGLSGRRVYLDANNNGTFDSGSEISVVTGGNGVYDFAGSGLTAGSYVVRTVAVGNEAVTSPSGGSYAITLVSNETRPNIDFGVSAGASISGTVFNDINLNGTQDGGDAGLVGEVVYLDLNNNGTRQGNEPTATTTANGAFTITGVLPGTYTLRIVTAGTDTVTTPVGGSYSVVANSGSTITGRNFGLAQAGQISGTVFNDTDTDGVFDPAESGIAGRTVYIDLDNDNILDLNETSVQTDGDGAFLFDVAAGSYNIRLVPIGGETLTTPALGLYTVSVGSGQVVNNRNFGVN